MNILQKIFTDYYEEIKYTLHPRKSEMENINKMINCGDPSFGGAMYSCPSCGNLKFVPFRCHSRFCPTCGNKYSMERSTSMLNLTNVILKMLSSISVVISVALLLPLPELISTMVNSLLFITISMKMICLMTRLV